MSDTQQNGNTPFIPGLTQDPNQSTQPLKKNYTDTQEFADLVKKNPAAAFVQGFNETITNVPSNATNGQTKGSKQKANNKSSNQQSGQSGPSFGEKWNNFWDGFKSKNSAPVGNTPSPTGNSTPSKEKSAIEQMRDKVAEFDEDYKDMGERLLGGFAQLVGYVGPFLLMLWIGTDLGKFFEGSMGTVPAFGLAYTIEGIIAALTVAMGRAFAEMGSGKSNSGKLAAVVIIWLVLNASSAFGLYLVLTTEHSVAQGSIEQFSMVVRVVAIALADLGCSAVLMFKGRSLQKHIESVRKRATAIGELADAQRSIEEADKNAELREQMMKSTLKIQEELSHKIGDAVSMVMTSILEKMEKALKEEDKNERGYGRR